MELLVAYFSMLRDSSLPETRVVRKTAVLALLAVVGLLYFRHGVLGFGTGEPLLVSVALALGVLGPVNVIFGVLNAAFYRGFLRDTGAKRTEQTLAVFFAEWLFAAAMPLACTFLGPLVA